MSREHPAISGLAPCRSRLIDELHCHGRDSYAGYDETDSAQRIGPTSSPSKYRAATVTSA